MFHDLALLRHAAGEQEGEAAQGVDILLDIAEPRVDRLGDFVEFGAGVGVPDAVLHRDQHAGGFLVMLVLDLADDLLDHIFNSDDTLGAPKLIHHRSEEHTSELQSLMRISYAVFCLKKKKYQNKPQNTQKPLT